MDCIQNNQILNQFAMNFIIYGPHPPKIILLHDMLNPIQMVFYIYMHTNSASNSNYLQNSYMYV